ncbi:MAG: hypothetical protein AAGA76_16210 [Pseudomonadota bacterium]
MVYIFALWLFAVLQPALVVAEDRLTLVVNRDEDSVAYFISMPATAIEPILAADSASLFSDRGAVPIDDFRIKGSFELGDQLFSEVSGAVAATGQSVEFESMSMMVHPIDEPQPFFSPWDAITATSVCNVDYARSDLVPEALQLYYGAFATDVLADQEVSLNFPKTGRNALKIDVFHYFDGSYVGKDTALLTDGGTLLLTTRSDPLLSILTALSAVFAAICMAALGLHFVRKRRTSNQGSLPEQIVPLD